MKIKKYIIPSIILWTYATIIFSHCFFKDSELNKFLSTKIFIAHFYSFPLMMGSAISILSLLFMLVFCYKKNKAAIFLYTITLLLSIIFMFFGIDSKIKPEVSSKKVIKLVEWNAENNIDEKNVYEIFKDFDADIAVFPELEGYEKGDVSNARLRDLFKKSELNFDDYESFISIPTNGTIGPVTIVVKKEFGLYSNVENLPMTSFGTVYLKSKDNNKPDIIGLHTAPPLPGLMDKWKRDLEFVAHDIVKNNPNAIIVGDFNATMRHGAMNDIKSHRDVLNYNSPFRRGTWNEVIPDIFKASIDHVLLPINKCSAKNTEIKDLKNSDHMAIFTEIISHY